MAIIIFGPISGSVCVVVVLHSIVPALLLLLNLALLSQSSCVGFQLRSSRSTCHAALRTVDSQNR